MKKLFLDDVRTLSMVYPNDLESDWDIVRNYQDFVNDLGLDKEGRVAPDGYAASKWLVYESGLDLRGLRYHVHSANPVAAEQIRGLFDNYLKYLKGQ